MITNSPVFQRSIIIGTHTIQENNKEKHIQAQKWNEKPEKKRVMICGTYPVNQSNGYSKVMYYTCKYLGLKEDIQLTLYGFQNFKQTYGGNIRNEIPKNVILHDAYETENPKRKGFGELEIGDYVKKNPQDIIIIFNDPIITTSVAKNLLNHLSEYRSKFKLMSYIDQVYTMQRETYIKFLNENFDGIIAFTPYWVDVAKRNGIKEDMPMYIYPHGFDTKIYYPIPTEYARAYFNIDKDAFCILNLNRNQPRKRYDTCIIAWCKFVEWHYLVNVKNIKNNDPLIPDDVKINKHCKRPVKFLFGTSNGNTDGRGYFDIYKIMKQECRFLEVPFEYVKETIWEVDMPQQMSDRDINILMSATDVGINTCDGEGYGLQQIENTGVGKPQVASNIGGMREFLDKSYSYLVDSQARLYGNTKEEASGIVEVHEICKPEDFSLGIWKYFSNPEQCKKHGEKGRRAILQHYTWEKVSDYFYDSCLKTL
jgi:glycosyltransferase involved in cell wall biosynthesis